MNKLGDEVLRFYDIAPQSICVIQGGSIKTVWKVETKDGPVCLKRLKQSYDKALFSVHAQIHIRKSGGRVPCIILSKSKEPIVQLNGQLFVLYEWLEGKSLDFNSSSDLIPSLQGLAQLHIHSKGYVPPKAARVSSKLGKWPEQYISMKKRMTDWKEISKQNPNQPHHAAYLKLADPIADICDLALNLIKKTDYARLTEPSSDSIVLCHQDFGKGNALMTEKGVYIIDLDGLTFDLPSRDLRKIIGKRAENKGAWEQGDIKSVLQAYESVNPLSNKEKEVLYIDMVFPHWYFGLVKNMFQSGKVLKTSEIERMAKLEYSKLSVLNTLISRGD
ncbi:MAG: CotS family spore coat protein [Clostridia bacterium]|nr:CotS family spore coat protein [Clostridia bacterium]